MRLIRLVSLAVILTLVDCGTPDDGKSDTAAGTGTADGDGDGDGADDGADDGGDDGVAGTNRADIIFVIDNSASMGAAQGKLAEAMPAFVDALHSGASSPSLRFGITTTDDGNFWCSGTTPEGGSFEASSCLDRLDEFMFNGATLVDASAQACEDVCPNGGIDFGSAAWLESDVGTTNFSGGTLAEALACAVPQGIAGCGFESPLESMYKALAGGSQDQSGFLREGSHLLVVIVTDEADCSAQTDTIFDPTGTRVFWSLPDEGAPTSSVCWNAGVSCSGGSCNSADLHPSTGASTDEDNAALYPMSRYIDRLESFGTGGVSVEIIAGFNGDGSVTYQDGSDQVFFDDYGIGRGCSGSGDTVGVPPVRLRELGEAFASTQAVNHSICDASFEGALVEIAERLVEKLTL